MKFSGTASDMGWWSTLTQREVEIVVPPPPPRPTPLYREPEVTKVEREFRIPIKEFKKALGIPPGFELGSIYASKYENYVKISERDGRYG